uniref:Uncharacterized protein n=1 Tax=Romanomermis culicivorax TaxID=13658 RepID=A0A915HM98_ROMCU
MNEQDIVDQLKKEGLLRPDSTKIKGKNMTFEVPLEELKVKSRRPPTRLAKLNLENGPNATNTIITTKMENAERLRLKLHNERANMHQKKSVKLLEMHLASIDVGEDLKSIKALSST